MIDLIRLEIIFGKDNLELLANSRVMILGLGGIGGFVTEGLVRSGIGNFVLVDFDIVDTSNFNRQIIAINENLHKEKTKVLKERIISINDTANVIEVKKFLKKEDVTELDFSDIDYIVDAIDTSTSKIALIEKAKELDIPIISSMGFGNKINTELIKISDISNTTVCPLAKVIRTQLRKKGIKDVKVAYSTEIPREKKKILYNSNGKVTVGSYAPVIAVAGFKIANEVVSDILRTSQKNGKINL